MLCPNCGTELDDSSKECFFCNHRFDIQEDVSDNKKKVCSFCGTELEDKVTVCNICGMSVPVPLEENNETPSDDKVHTNDYEDNYDIQNEQISHNTSPQNKKVIVLSVLLGVFIIFAGVLAFLFFGGNKILGINNSSNDEAVSSENTIITDTTIAETTIKETTSSGITPYSLKINNPKLDIYESPSYFSKKVGEITDKGSYTIVEVYTDKNSQEENSDWGKLESGLGWINLFDATDTFSFNEDEYILPYSDVERVTESDLDILSSKEIMLARNEIYARHGVLFGDNEIQDYFDSKSWYVGTVELKDFSADVFNSIEKYNIDFIVDYESNLTSNDDNPSLYSYDRAQEDKYDEEDDSYQEEETEPPLDIKTKTVDGVDFRYVSSYNRIFEGADTKLDYNISINVKYCKPNDYMSDDDRIIGITNSTGMYDKNDIGSLYKSAGTDDFAVFEVSINGNYSNKDFYANYIDYRKYSNYGVLLRDYKGNTDHEMISFSEQKGKINSKFYLGFYKSEVGSVDFILFGVSPDGLFV